MKRAVRGLTRINAFGEALPNIENRIELVNQKDELGMPLARVVHSYDQDARGVQRQLRRGPRAIDPRRRLAWT